MNDVYKPRLKAGARVRVLATNELGTIADKQLIRKNGQTKVYCNVRLDKSPDQDTWYFADLLGDTKERAIVTMADERGRKLILNVTQYYDRTPDKNNMHVELEAEDGGNLQDHEGSLHFALTALLFKAPSWRVRRIIPSLVRKEAMKIFVAMNLTHHLPDDARSWIPTYADRMGWEKLKEYYDRVFLRLERMRPGEKLVVWQEVVPNNYDLFLHCAYTAICELQSYGISSYYFDDRRP